MNPSPIYRLSADKYQFILERKTLVAKRDRILK